MRLFGTIILAVLLVPAVVFGRSNTIGTVSGICPEFQDVGFQVIIDYMPTGGDFGAGTGTAEVKFTLENTSGLYPFQVPALGNPILTGFYFNVPPGTGVVYGDASILTGSTLFSTGTNINGFPVPAGCIELDSDLSHPEWYQLLNGATTGQFGIFTNALTTEEGVKAGVVDPEVFVNCVAQGDVFSPVVIAGQVCFTVLLSNLDTTLDTAAEFRDFCSVAPGDQQISWIAGKFQGTGTAGEESCFAGEPCPVPVEASTWGVIKSRH